MSEQTIIQGDCLEVMKTFPDKSFDLVLTDPPYSLPNNQFRPESRISQRTFGDFSPYQTFWREFIKEIRRVLTDEGDVIIFCDETFYPVIYPELYAHFYATKLLVWDKKRIGMGGIWRRQYELITHSYLQPKKQKSGDGDILVEKPVREKLHNSQKPTLLLERLIQKTGAKSILDPFAGSGSTGIAAKKLGIDCTLIEISEKYCEIAQKRLDQEFLFHSLT